MLLLDVIHDCVHVRDVVVVVVVVERALFHSNTSFARQTSKDSCCSEVVERMSKWVEGMIGSGWLSTTVSVSVSLIAGFTMAVNR